VEEGDASGPRFSHSVFVHSEAAGLEGLATGKFEDPAFVYGAVAVDSKYSHALNFLMTPFMPPWLHPLATHGPTVLYSDDMNVIVFSPMDNFFSSLVWLEGGAVHYGLHGDIDSVPDGFQHRFIMVEGRGISATILEWGRLLRQDRGKNVVDRYSDPGQSYLGYWTDNGAYYYYKTEPNLNEQDTLLALKANLDAADVPVGYMQLDSWWYFKDGNTGLWPPSGLLLWEPIPEMFPDGLATFHELIGLPLVLHNRWFDKDSPYVQQWDFAVEDEMAIPTGQEVYDHFMKDAASWGAITYEQDWLITQYWGLAHLRSRPGRAEEWMAAMDNAASGHGLTMQLCMEGAAHLMDSVDRTSYTTVRTSTDYHADLSKETYWPQFFTVGMLASAVGLWPFKDNFQSSEKHGAAEALVAAMSAGMVGIGDGIGKVVPGVVMRLCRDDGLLLKPDAPALPLDGMFLPHNRPFTVAALSVRDDLGTTTYLAAFHIARNHPERTDMDRVFSLLSYDEQDVGNMFFFPEEVTDWSVDLQDELGIEGEVVVYDWRSGSAQLAKGAFSMPPVEHLYDFGYFVLAPVQPNGLAFLGEPGKYVTLADRRFSKVEATPDGFKVHVEGVPGEEIEFLAFDAEAGGMLPAAKVVIQESGEGEGAIAR